MELKDGKVEASLGKVEASVSGNSKDLTPSISPESVSIGAEFGIFGVTVLTDLGEGVDAVGVFFGTIGSYIKAAGQEANEGFFKGHGKSQ